LGIAPTNLSFLLADDASQVLRALFSSIDVFTIWKILLLIVGLAAIAGTRKITTAKTGALVIGLWLLILMIGLGFAALGFGAQ